MATDYQK